MDVKGVVAALAGLLLMYSAVKNYDPRDVIKWSLGGPKPKAN